MLVEMPVASASSATVPALQSQVPCQLPGAVWVRAVHGGVPGSRFLAQSAGSSTPPGHRFQVTGLVVMIRDLALICGGIGRLMLAPGTDGVGRTAEQCNVLAFDAAVEMEPVDGPGDVVVPGPVRVVSRFSRWGTAARSDGRLRVRRFGPRPGLAHRGRLRARRPVVALPATRLRRAPTR